MGGLAVGRGNAGGIDGGDAGGSGGYGADGGKSRCGVGNDNRNNGGEVGGGCNGDGAQWPKTTHQGEKPPFHPPTNLQPLW